LVTVLDMMKRLEKISVTELAAESIEDTRKDLIEWQQEQLFAGKNSRNRDIKPPYTRRTKRIKRAKGQPDDRVTLRDKHDFYDAIFVDIRAVTFVISSADWKTPKLIDKYGKSIFGLGGVFKIGYVNDLRPAMVNNLRKKLL